MRKKLFWLSAFLCAGNFGFVSRIGGEELKIQKTVSSSIENKNPEIGPEKAVDGNISSRWASDWTDPQWIYFDLGQPQEFNLITINWETANGKVYEIQTSNDALNWKTIHREENGDGEKDTIPVGTQKARYVRMYGMRRGTEWGYSIYELKILLMDDSLVPPPPPNLTAIPGSGKIIVEWSGDPKGNLCGYNIYRSVKLGGNFEKINRKIVEATRYADRNLSAGTPYYYFVKSVGYSMKESKASEKVSGTPLPAKRTLLPLSADKSIDKGADELLSKMDLEEKINQMGGAPKIDDLTTYPNERLGILSIKCADGPHGVRIGKATAFPVSISIAASWDPDLMRRNGAAIAKECKGKGRNMSLGPCLNICRDPRGGRTHEGYGEDPYLTARMAVAAVKGIQSQNVIPSAKHLACNNIEKGRGGGPVVIDERTLREIYLPAFKACVKEGKAWALMCAYNKINGSYCGSNEYLLRDILKDEWGFQGFVISDWGACHSTEESVKGGLDIEMPVANYYGKSLLDAVKNGSVSEELINDSVKRILRVKLLANLVGEEPKPDPSAPFAELRVQSAAQSAELPSVVECKEHIELALEGAKKSLVLLKNKNGLLPLDRNKIKSIAVVGPNANLTTAGVGLGSSQIDPSYVVTPLQGIQKKIGGNIKITDKPEEADVTIVFAGLTESIAGRVEGEGIDREYLHLPGNQDNLIKEISEKNKNCIVVLIGGSAITMNDWIDNVPAVVMAWYPGQEGGTAIADMLFGDYNPGGKLPLTFPKSMDQLRPMEWDYTDEWKTGVGYRYFDKKNMEPLFPFGYGLSYTTFEYSNLTIEPKESNSGVITVSVSLKNSGKRKGDEVVQLYLQDVESSVERFSKELKGFKRITLEPGETKRITFKLTPEEMAFYDKNMKFVVEPGLFKVMVGGSSKDIHLTDSFKITKLIPAD